MMQAWTPYTPGKMPGFYMPVAGASGSSPQAGGSSYQASGMMAGPGFFMDPSKLYADYNSKYAEAKDANVGRYNQGMQEYGDLYNRNMGRLDTLSNQNEQDIRQTGGNAKAANGQRMNSLGLEGTTVGDVLNRGVDRDTQANLNRNRDQLTGMKNQEDATLKGAQLGFLERRSDPYPDMGVYGSLMSSMGKMAAGSGGGGGAGGAGGQSGGAFGGYAQAYGNGLAPGVSNDMASMFVPNSGGTSVVGGENVYGSPEEIARAKAMRASGTIATDPMAGTSSGSGGTNSRFGSAYLPYSSMYQPQMMARF